MGKSLSIIGFGSQAKAWALNLRDSGYQVFIGLRPGSSSLQSAQSLGFKTFDYQQEVPSEDVALLTPDDTHLEILRSLPSKKLNIIFAHGYSLLYENISSSFSNFECLLLAPKAIASEVRLQYETKGKLGALFSVELSSEKGSALKKVQTIAKDLGIESLHETSVEAETKADLFSEQTILCSTLPYAALHSFNKLIEKGINTETAYFECWHEVKLIADTMVKLGPAKFFQLISPNALAGSEVGRKALYGQDFLDKLETIYKDIDSGKFSETLKHVDFNELKKEVVSFWKEQPLNKAHEKLSKELY